jgi:hypothetical protein
VTGPERLRTVEIERAGGAVDTYTSRSVEVRVSAGILTVWIGHDRPGGPYHAASYPREKVRYRITPDMPWKDE